MILSGERVEVKTQGNEIIRSVCAWRVFISLTYILSQAFIEFRATEGQSLRGGTFFGITQKRDTKTALNLSESQSFIMWTLCPEAT
ncbi:hypothetical protein Cadr_000020959 [Camelus dromedarius]|uniref:Uncharacterized protein n=1 Tax=Camelus dromedarius TaxID=9838 RepID=A0A5N4CUS1_CAMDR|nr:hypothetical protein Cadr_000020959 [Camelus dromedarius]